MGQICMKKIISIFFISLFLASSIVAATKTQTASPQPLSRGEFVYSGGDVTQKVYQYWASNLTKRTESIDYGSGIREITDDGTYLYISGLYTGTIWQLWPINLTKRAESVYLSDHIYALEFDGTYLYAGGASPWRVYQIWPSNLTIRQESESFGDYINAISIDQNYVYAGGSIGIKQLWKTNLTVRFCTPVYDWPIFSLCVQGDSLFAGTSWMIDNGVIKKFWISNMTEATSIYYGGTVYDVISDGTYLYAGGHNVQRVCKYLLSDLSFVGESENYGAYIGELTYDGTYIYVTGRTPTAEVWQLWPSNLTVRAQSGYYGGNDEAVWTMNHIDLPPNKPNNPYPADHSIYIARDTSLSWSGGSPGGELTKYDVYFGTTPSPVKVSSNQTSMSYTPPNILDWNTTYYWKIVAWNPQGSNQSTLWSFTTIPETSLPALWIVKPQAGYIYLRDIEYMRRPMVNLTIALKQLTVQIYTNDSESGIRNVEYYVNDKLMANVTKSPYSWLWDTPSMSFSIKTLKIIAYDNEGNANSCQLALRKIL